MHCMYAIAQSATTPVVTISARNTKVYKIRKPRNAIFCTLYNISQPNFGFCLILQGSLREFSFLRLDRKFV